MSTFLSFNNFGAGGTSPNTMGATYALSVGATNAQATTPTGFTDGGPTVRIFNSGNNPVFVTFGIGAQIAAIPVANTPQPGIMVAPGAVEVFGIPATADSFAAIGTASGPSVIYVTRGDGL